MYTLTHVQRPYVDADMTPLHCLYLQLHFPTGIDDCPCDHCLAQFSMTELLTTTSIPASRDQIPVNIIPQIAHFVWQLNMICSPTTNSSDRSNISSVIWLLFNCFRMGLIIKTLLALYCEWCVTVSSRKLEWVSIQSVTMSRWPRYGKCLDTRPEKQASWVALGAASKVIFISRL